MPDLAGARASALTRVVQNAACPSSRCAAVPVPRTRPRRRVDESQLEIGELAIELGYSRVAVSRKIGHEVVSCIYASIYISIPIRLEAPVKSAQLARRRLLAGAFASAVVLCAACSSSPTAPSPQDPSAPVRVLMLTATAGFRHDSIATARQVLANLAGQTRAFTVTATEDLSAFSASNLANYDVLFFALTSGDLAFTADQKAAILAFVSRGGGFLGAHSATDTLYNWPEYRGSHRCLLQGTSLDAAGIRHRREHRAPDDVRTWRSLHDRRGVLRVSRQPSAPGPGPPAAGYGIGCQLRRLPAGVGQVVRERPRLLQRARALSGDVERLTVPATIDRGDSVGGRTLMVPFVTCFPLSWL